MPAFLESYLNFLSELFSEILHDKILFGARVAFEGAVWTFLIGIAYAALYELCFACRRFQRLYAMERGRS